MALGKMTKSDIKAYYGRGNYSTLANRAVAEISEGDVLTLTDWCIDHAIVYPTPEWGERQMRFTGWVFDDHSRIIFDDNSVPHVCDRDGHPFPTPPTDTRVTVGSVWTPDRDYTYEVTSVYQGHTGEGLCTLVAYRCREHTQFHTQMEISRFLLRFLRKDA